MLSRRIYRKGYVNHSCTYTYAFCDSTKKNSFDVNQFRCSSLTRKVPSGVCGVAAEGEQSRGGAATVAGGRSGRRKSIHVTPPRGHPRPHWRVTVESNTPMGSWMPPRRRDIDTLALPPIRGYLPVPPPISAEMGRGRTAPIGSGKEGKSIYLTAPSSLPPPSFSSGVVDRFSLPRGAKFIYRAPLLLPPSLLTPAGVVDR